MSNNEEFNTNDLVEEAIEREIDRRAEKPRVAKLMFLGGLPVSDKTTGAIKGVSIILLDAIEIDTKTGQPVLRGFNSVINTYVKDPDESILALLDLPVFTIVYVYLSGNDQFTRLHGVLSKDEVEFYQKLMDRLLYGKGGKK